MSTFVEGNRLAFVNQVGAPDTDPASRKLTKNFVMKHVGKSKRKPGLRRRQVALQFTLDVPDTIASEDLSSQITPDLPKSLHPYLHDDSEDQSASHDAILITDRLGAGRFDPFIKFPITMDSRSRELIDTMFDTQSGSATSLRESWFAIGILDAASFHQLLAGASSYYRSLRTGRAEIDSEDAIAHHAYSLRLVNSNIKYDQRATSDGTIGAVVGFACYYNRVGDFKTWQAHVAGLREIIRLRGGADSVNSLKHLRFLLNCVDLSGSSTLDIAPSFPIPPAPPRTISISTQTTHSSPAHHLNITWRSIAPAHITLIDIIQDLCIENSHIQAEILSATGQDWPDATRALQYINPLLHRLLSLPPLKSSIPASFLAECLRLAAIIYLASVRRAFGVRPVRVGIHLRKIKALYDRWERTSGQIRWEEVNLSWVELWILGFGMIFSQNEENHDWFVRRFYTARRTMLLKDFEGFESLAKGFLWIPEIHEPLLKVFKNR